MPLAAEEGPSVARNLLCDFQLHVVRFLRMTPLYFVLRGLTTPSDV
jgi:hypothetical protein